MTLVCAPVKKWPAVRSVDLYEFTEGAVKIIFDREEHIRFIDIDWKEKAPSHLDHLIVSYHNFQETPDLDEIFAKMRARHPKACYYKLATFATSTLDALHMLHFQKKHPNVIGLCMGEKGSVTRILAPVMGAPIAYAPLEDGDKNALGQLLWSELSCIYRFRELNSSTQIFGLIGDPVRQSIGHLFHNDQFRQRQANGVYVKMPLKAGELKLFFEMIQDLPIIGLSVTAPLKEEVIPYLQPLAKKWQPIGAVNTVYRTKAGWEGVNTDGPAAADSLGTTKNKQVVLLGAGGAAKAIAYELIKRGAIVTIVNRTFEKGKQLAAYLGCKFSEKIPSYDILVNATSSPDPLSMHNIIPGATLMDIAIEPTPFLEKALSQACHTIDGFPMYFKQASMQAALFQSLLASISS